MSAGCATVDANAPNASTLFIAAWSYCNAMKLIVHEVNEPGMHNLGAPFAMLAGFALELGFKATLAARGKTERDLKAIRHSLSAAMDAALAEGLTPNDPAELKRVVQLLDEPHSKLQMRYIPAGIESIKLPGPDASVAAIEDLLNSVWLQYPVIAESVPSE